MLNTAIQRSVALLRLISSIARNLKARNGRRKENKSVAQARNIKGVMERYTDILAARLAMLDLRRAALFLWMR